MSALDEIIQPFLQVCKPDLNRTIQGNLTSAYKIEKKESLGNINELTFLLPIECDIKHQLKFNPDIKHIKERFIIKFEQGYFTEYYIIHKVRDIMDEGTEYKQVECLGLGYELSSKLIKDYNVVSKNASQVLVDILQNTIWNFDYIDADFDLKFRSVEIDTSTVLDAVFKVAEAFNALITWNTIDRTINLYSPDNIGINKGLLVKYGSLMKTVDREFNTDEFCTRLRVFGKDGLSIQSVNSTGTNFIQSFYYFMYPFQRDEDGIIVSHSDYMSDGLCIAIEDYEELIEDNADYYAGLLESRNSLYSQLITKQNELFILESTLAIIEDQLAVLNANGDNPATKIAEKNAKQVEIDAKNAEIVIVNGQIDDNTNDIVSLRSLLSMEINFSSDELIELNQFIIEKEFKSDYYTDADQLLLAAKDEFNKIREPKIIVNLSVVNFFEILSERHNWNRLSIGDVVTIQHEKLKIDIEAKITEMTYNYEDRDISLTIANVKELLSDEERFIKGLYKSISSSTTVDHNKYKWNEAKATADDVSQILNNTWDAVQRDIVAGANNEVKIGRKGIRIVDPTDSLKMVILQHNQVALTSDGGNTWKTAMTPDGVYAERLIGKILMGNQLTIQDNDGTFFIEGNLLTVKDTDDVVRLLLGEYESGKFGLKLMSKDGNQVVLDENGLLQSWQESAQENLDASNPLVLNIFIPSAAISVRETRLRFKLLPFRSYSTGAASGGGSSTTSESGGSINTTSANGGGTTTTTNSISRTNTDSGVDVSYGTANTTGTFGSSEPSHYHAFTRVTGHNHDITHTHQIVLANHNHSIIVPAHTHTVFIPSHSHALIHGIFTSTTPQNVTVTINGVSRTAVLGGGTGFNSDQNNLDITQYIQIGQWNTISLGTSRLGRLDASIFNQIFMGV